MAAQSMFSQQALKVASTLADQVSPRPFGPPAIYFLSVARAMPTSSRVLTILNVEDNSSLVEITAELLRALERQAQRTEAIILVSDLQTASLCLPEHYTAVCDGMFPLSHDSRFVVEEWDVVRQEANRPDIHFVLYSGLVRALDCARESNAMALAKPAAIEEIYATLTGHRVSVMAKSHREEARKTENGKFIGEDHVANF